MYMYIYIYIYVGGNYGDRELHIYFEQNILATSFFCYFCHHIISCLVNIYIYIGWGSLIMAFLGKFACMHHFILIRRNPSTIWLLGGMVVSWPCLSLLRGWGNSR